MWRSLKGKYIHIESHNSLEVLALSGVITKIHPLRGITVHMDGRCVFHMPAVTQTTVPHSMWRREWYSFCSQAWRGRVFWVGASKLTLGEMMELCETV